MRRRRKARGRARELDERAMAGEGKAVDGLEALRIMRRAFRRSGDGAGDPPIRMSVEAYSGIIAEVTTGRDEVATKLRLRSADGVVVAREVRCAGQAARATPNSYLRHS